MFSQSGIVKHAMSRLSTHMIHVARLVAAILLSIHLCGCNTLPERQKPLHALSGIYFSAKEPGRAAEFYGGRCFLRMHGGAQRIYECSVQDSSVTITSCCRVITLTESGGILRDQDGGTWTRTMPSTPADRLEHKPVTIEVLDGVSGKPVSHFRYRYDINSAAGEEYPPFVRWQTATNTNGIISFDAPRSCQIDLGIDAVEGITHDRSRLTVRRDDTVRRYQVRIKRGSIVRGVVREETTGDPIVGATVAPVMSVDRDRTVRTDSGGRFEVHSVEPRIGLDVRHRDYTFERDMSHDGIVLASYDEQIKEAYEIDIKGHKIATTRVSGRVIDPSGQPIRGVDVDGGYERRTVTDAKGQFDLLTANSTLSLQHPDYASSFHEFSNSTLAVTVIMQPLPIVCGRVLDAKGQPQRVFMVSTGSRFDPPFTTVTDDRGEFRLSFGEFGERRIAVKATGFAVWAESVFVTQLVSKVEARLSKGTQVSGRVILPPGVGQQVSVQISSQQGGTSLDPEQCLNADGFFRFGEVLPGTHLLKVGGLEISPVEYIVRVPSGGRTVPDISIKGTGCVKGRLHENLLGDRDPDSKFFARAFTRGRVVSPFRTMSFTTDEDGYYFVTNVPCGPVTVEVRNWEMDRGTTSTVPGDVRPGETTEINVDDPSNATGATEIVELDLVVGDGSEAQRHTIVDAGNDVPTSARNDRRSNKEFEVRLMEPSGSFLIGNYFSRNPVSKDITLTQSNSTARLRYIPRGDYTVYVDDLPYQKIHVPQTNCTFRVHLPPTRLKGCLNLSTNDNSSFVRIFVPVKTNDLTGCRTFADGIFDFRFIAPDNYVLYAIAPHTGWLRQKVSISNGVHNMGSVALTPGATITGRLNIDWQKYEPDARIVASDSQGISISESIRHADGARFEFNQLWPDLWTVKLVANDATLMSKTVRVTGTETVTMDLIAPPFFLPLSNRMRD